MPLQLSCFGRFEARWGSATETWIFLHPVTAGLLQNDQLRDNVQNTHFDAEIGHITRNLFNIMQNM